MSHSVYWSTHVGLEKGLDKNTVVSLPHVGGKTPRLDRKSHDSMAEISMRDHVKFGAHEDNTVIKVGETPNRMLKYNTITASKSRFAIEESMDVNEFSENYQKSLQNHSNTVNTSGNDHDIALEDDDNCIQNDKTPIQYSESANQLQKESVAISQWHRENKGSTRMSCTLPTLSAPLLK